MKLDFKNLKLDVDKLRAMAQTAMDKKPAADGLAAKPKIPFVLPKWLKLDLRFTEASRYLSNSSLFEKAMGTFDRSTLIIISVAWLVAVVMMGLAFIGVKNASDLKSKVEIAKALDPFLPKINRLPLTHDQYQPLMERLKKQFPEVMFEITGRPALRIYSNNSDYFVSWLNTISYTDSMVPAIRWSMVSFCVGTECPTDFVMSAEMTAEAINITQPESSPIK